MKEVIAVIGSGAIAQAIARRVGVGKHILLADKKELERLNSVSGQKAMSTDFKGQNGNNLKRQQKVSRSKLKEVEKQQSDFE